MKILAIIAGTICFAILAAQNESIDSTSYNTSNKNSSDGDGLKDVNESQATNTSSKSKKKTTNNTIPGVLIPVTFLLSISCFTLNIFVSSYYKREIAKHIVSWLYFVTSIVDILTSVGVFLLGIVLTYYYINTSQSKVISVLIYFSTLITGVGIRTCVFLNVTLTTIRSIYISNPFYTVRKKLVFVCLALYALFWTIAGSCDIYYTIAHYKIFHKSRYLTKGLILRPLMGHSLAEEIVKKITQSEISYGEQIIIAQTPFLLACLIFFICLIAQMYALLSAARKRPHTKEYYKSATTILILTIIFVTCNTMATVLWIYVYSDSLKTRDYIFKPSPTGHALIYTSGTICNLLSSLLMSIILISRSTDLKRYVLYSMCRSGDYKGKGELMVSKGMTMSTIKSVATPLSSTQATV